MLEIGLYVCAGVLGIVWLVALQTRLRTLTHYYAESGKTAVSYFKAFQSKRFEWLYIFVNLIVVLLLFGFLRDTVICLESCMRSVITVVGLSCASALFALVIYPRAVREAPEKRPLVLVVASTVLCFCVSVVLAMAIFDALLPPTVNGLSNLDFLLNTLTSWPITGGALSLLVAIIAVPLVSPIVAAVESALGIKAE